MGIILSIFKRNTLAYLGVHLIEVFEKLDCAEGV